MADRSRNIAQLLFLGGQRIEIGSEVITPDAERLFAMLVRLSVPLGRLTSRQTMMESLWPGVSEQNARHNLRQTVYKARELGMVVEAGEGGLRLDPRYWACDWDAPVGDVPGEWLPHYDPVFSDALAVWVSAQRMTVHAAIRPRIMRAMQTARSAGDLHVADRYARQLLGIDTLNEEATLIRAEVLAMQGAKVDALRLLDTYLEEIGRMGAGRDAALPAQLLRRRIAEKLPAVTYHAGESHHGVLVGRHREMKRLTAALFDARAGRGVGVVLHGGDGIGKSRLLHEVKKSAVLQGMRIFTLACDSTPSAQAFAAMRAMVARLLEWPGAMGVSPDALQTLHTWLGSNEFAPDDCPSSEIEDLLASIADETPMLVVVEHAERIDDASLAVLDRVYRRGVSRYHTLVATTRTRAVPTDSSLELQWMERLSLSPMTTVEVRAIVTAYAAAEQPRATQDQIACASVFAEGVPMYGIEMLGLMLDAGSPDVVPWRVQVAVDRALRELSDVQCRVLALVRQLRASARQTVVAEALREETVVLAEALHRLEAYGYLACDAGVLQVSALLSDAAAGRVPANVSRADMLRAAVSLLRVWKVERDPVEFFVAVRACVAAGEETKAAHLLDREAGWLIRSETAQVIVHELGGVIEAAGSDRLKGLAESIREQVGRGAEGRRGRTRKVGAVHTPQSLPESGSIAGETEHDFAHEALFLRAIAAARNTRSPASQRLADAVSAIVIADNLNCRTRMSEAALVVADLEHSPTIQRFDVVRAKLILAASSGETIGALDLADQLASEARTISDIRLACQGLRNAADVHATFGQLSTGQRYAHESRELASKHGYALQVAYVDCDLAFFAMERLDCNSADAYLQNAEEIACALNQSTPLLLADIAMARCWSSTIRGDAIRASKHAKSQAGRSDTASDSNMALAVAISRLATLRGSWGPKASSDFRHVLATIGARPFYYHEMIAVASLLISSEGRAERTAAVSAFEKHRAAREFRGQPVWPFLGQLLNR